VCPGNNYSAAAKEIMEDYEGKVPTDRKDLATLSGIGQQFADLLGFIFEMEGKEVNVVDEDANDNEIKKDIR